MEKPTTAVLDIDLIDVEEGFNPRREFDNKKMAELVASIRQSGLATALTVRPNGGTKYVLVAGERRLIAAKEAGLKQVPVVIREKKGALAAAIAENLIRADLNPIEEAEGLQRLAELERLGTQKDLAKRSGKSSAFVGGRLRLLQLPEKVQSYIASGVVPVEAERALRPIAKVSPRIAECACELVAKGAFRGHELLTDLDEVLLQVAETDFKDAPTMIQPRGFQLSTVVEDEDAHAKLAERYNAAVEWRRSEDPKIRLGEPEIDAARAAGCLVEIRVDHGEWISTVRYLTDAVLAADLAERAIVRYEKQAKKEARKRDEQLKEQSAEQASSAKKREKEREQERREEERKEAVARGFNEGLGRKLIKRRGSGRSEHGLRRAKALAAMVLATDDGLAARGLRLVLPQLRDVSAAETKKKAEVVSYADRKHSADYLADRVAKAKSVSEVLEILTEALLAALLVDEEAVSIREAVSWSSPAEEQIKELLQPEIKALRLARSRGGK